MSTPTKKQIGAAVAMTAAVAEAVRAAGSEGVPAGTLYAALVGRVSHEGFEKLVGLLVRAALVRREANHLLVWSGPNIEGA